MSEGKAKVDCKNCHKKVPFGKFCIECGNVIETESTDGGVDDGPRPPIQASDASSESTQFPSQQNDDTSKNTAVQSVTISVSTTTNSNAHQSKVPGGEVPTVIPPVTAPSSYADALKSQQNNNVVTTQSSTGPYSEPSRYASGHPYTSQRNDVRSENTQKPENERNGLREGQGLPPTSGDFNMQIVYFHVIIPVAIWEWNEICYLGINIEQERKYLSISEKSWAKYGAIVVTAHVQLSSFYMDKKIPYKYFVRYPTGAVYFEYIHDMPVSCIANRCLELNYQAKGVYHVYDGFIFPTLNWHEKIINYLKNVNISTMESHGYALLIHLQSRIKINTTEMTLTGSTMISDLFEGVCKVYFLLKQKNYMNSDKVKGCIYFNCNEHLQKGLKKWFLQTIEYLSNHQGTTDEKRVWSAGIVMALVIIMKKTGTHSVFDVNAFEIMFTYLCLEKNQREHVVGLMDKPLREEVASGIAHVCSLSIVHAKNNGSYHCHWLYAVPLLHQLQSQDGVTDDHTSVNPYNVDWGINGLDKDRLQDFKCLVQNKRLMKNLFIDLENHMKSDHLLLNLLVYLSTEDDVDVILDHTVHCPVHIFALHVSNQCQQYDKLTQKKSEKIGHTLKKISQHITKFVDEKEHRFSCIMIAAKNILVKLASICSQDQIPVLYCTIQLYMVALSAYVHPVPVSAEHGEKVSNYIADIQKHFVAWFNNARSGFEDTFGGKNGKKMKNEIKFWNDTLALGNSCQILPCIIKEWKFQMRGVIHNRIHSEQLKVSIKVDIALEICNSNEIDTIFSDIVWESIGEVMEDDTSLKETQDLIDNKPDNSNIGILLSRLLVHYYAVKDINLVTILKFHLWPKYLKHFVSNDDKLAKNFSEECIKKCTEIHEYIMDLIGRLTTGSIRVDEFHMLTSHTAEVVELFSVATTKSPVSLDFSQLIAQRKGEMEKFYLHKTAIEVLLEYCRDISEGDLIRDLQDNVRMIQSEEQFKTFKISELYEEIDGNEVYALLDINDSHVIEMLQPFVVMMHDYKNSICQIIWYCHRSMAIPEGDKLSLPEVATNIWEPCFKEIQQLVEKFCDRSVSLQEIDQYLTDVNLEEEISQLVEGCNKCLNKTPPTTWIPHFVNSVKHYRIINKAKDVADLVIAAKDALKMGDGFEKLEDCKEKMFGQTNLSLEEFEQEGYNFEELETIATDDKKLEFLKVLSSSQKLIEWLQRETKDVTELHNLVGLSMLEDNAATMDRAALLHTVGSAIAPLVYKLDPSTGLSGFLKACEPVWKAIEVNPELPDSFKTCCNELNFLKLIKDLQAPIEVSTYDRIQDILESGKYYIGSKRFRFFNNIKEIIILRVQNSLSSKQKYTLNELQELESKIVLIRDHRSSSDKLPSDKIEYFLNTLHFALHIADTLLHLQRAGHPQYIEWRKSFDFQTMSEKDMQMQNLNQDMKKDLQNWLNKVSNLRAEYYALNYFTCLQLLRINREFLNLINNPDNQISREVFLLLLSISSDLTITDIKEVVFTFKHKLISSKNMTSSLEDNDSMYITNEVDIPGKVEKLTKEEKEVYDSLQEYEFEPHMVLVAIRKFGPNEEDVAGWCLDPENKKMFESTFKGEYSNCELTETQIDIGNETVQQLIDLEFPIALSIEAVKHCGEDLTLCIEYCSSHILESGSTSDTDTDDKSISMGSIKFSCSDLDESDAEDSCLSATSEETSMYFDLKDMGIILDNLAKKFSTVQSTRQFIKCFEKGTPNFLCVPSCAIFKTTISIYAQDKLSPLPSLEEILICNERTTVEEISLLWYRAARDPEFRRIFCLVNGEKLSYQVCVKSFELMDEILKEIEGYQVVIICSNDAEDKRSYIMDYLQFFHRAINIDDQMICKYLKHHLTNRVYEFKKEISASHVDPNKCTARVIRSERAGMGKSLYVKRLTSKLREKLNQPVIAYPLCVTIPIYGPTVNFDEVMKSLLQHTTYSTNFADSEYSLPQIFHFDIASTLLDKVDSLLFSVLVLKGFNDGCGNVWRCLPKQLYLVEVTYELSKQDESDDVNNCSFIGFLELIPTITCYGPSEALSHKPLRENANYWDEGEISSDHYQRPYKFFLQLSDESAYDESPSEDLDNHSFVKSEVWSLANKEKILRTVLKHFSECGVDNPSWMELKHFLKFLYAQFEDCECSIFCNAAVMEQDLPGFKTFVVKFMLKMSKDFAVPSLKANIKYQNLHLQSTRSSLVGYDSVTLSQNDDIAASPIKFATSTPKKPKSRVLLDTNLEVECHSKSISNVSTVPIASSLSLEFNSSKDISSTEFDNDIIEQLQIHTGRVWDKNYHPYIFFNKDHNSMTFIGFSVNDFGDLIDPANKRVIHKRLLSRQLLRGLRAQQVAFSDDGSNDQMELLNKLLMVMGIDSKLVLRYPDKSYVLTADNTKKILAILMRFRCNIPVVLMGETGCGKTRLIKYMCDLLSMNSDNETLVIMKVHGGITEEDIVKEVAKARKLAKQNSRDGLDTVMFFDEANTTEAIGLIKEVMCDGRIRGEPIKENIKFIAACNPYKKHSAKMIDKLENAGLGYYVHSVNTKQKLGNIPLRHLVYRVLDLPSSMQSLVYDFGQLSCDTEKNYAKRIVENYQENIRGIDVCRVTDVLMACQNFMKKKDDECSFVSLRDIERAMIVLEWFYKVLDIIEKDALYADSKLNCDRHTRALILTIAVCYYTKLQCRDDFKPFISSCIMRSTEKISPAIDIAETISPAIDIAEKPANDIAETISPGIDIAETIYPAIDIAIGDDDDDDDDDDENDENEVDLFTEEIIRCQEVFLRNMKIPPFVACNAALRENVFMMVVCIELKIPLFLVGKPGSSKSLAKSIVADSMQGAASSNSLFQHFKQVQQFSYQCSEHSTSETILEVFDNAREFQEKKKGQNCVSVVVLDEVGLAEDSPSLPLKTLHPLLEDGTTKSNDIKDRVAFIGISNWALDPAKMNRGIMVTRSDPDVGELVTSARGICTSNGSSKVHEDLDCFFDPFAKAYIKICHEQTKDKNEFFGLRDFYSLIKMMYSMFQKNKYQKLTMNQLQHCLRRNFGGRSNVNEIVDMFLEDVPAKYLRNEEITSDNRCDSTSLGLIKASLQSKDASWHGEDRYLLLLTENYSALRILQQANLLDHDPLVLFGSSFPQDLNYTQVCRNINQIKFCMDKGRTVILLNLEHLYASLYDLLNQYYITLSNTRYVDLGLQSHRIKCRVNPNFKLVLIADKDKVYEEFPTPLINRLEKHYLVTSIILSENQMKLKEKIEFWVKSFSRVLKSRIGTASFTETDAFVGYQSDTPASIVFKVWQELKLDDAELSDHWDVKALSRSKEYLLQMATPDAVIRCKHSEIFTESKQIMQSYFNIYSYISLDELLRKMLNKNPSVGMLIQITTHASLLQYKNLISIQKSLNISKDQISLLMLQQFDTEIDFCSKIKSIFQRESADNHLLIVQCDSGHHHIDLIACARYRVLDEIAQASHLKKITHIIFIIGLPRKVGGTTFVSFQGGKWESYHIDSLMPPKDSFFTIQKALDMSIHDMLLDCYNNDKELFYKRIHSCISPATLLQFSNVPTDNTLQRYDILSQLVAINHISEHEKINETETECLDQLNYTSQYDFYGALHQHIFKTLKVKKITDFQLHEKEWVINQAMKCQDLHKYGSFINLLSCKVDEKIVMALNVILNSVDKYCNLHLLKSNVCVISHLWYKIFEDGDLFLNIATELEHITAGNKTTAFTTFKCQFPFFWLIINSIENQLKIRAGQKSLDVYNILSTNSKSIISKLNVISSDDVQDVFNCYIHDFVLFFCDSSEESDNAKIYKQIICKEYEAMVQDISPDDLLHRMILLHMAYHKIENCLQRLKHIMIFDTNIPSKLQSYFEEENAIGIDLYAVQQLLEFLQPAFKEWASDDGKEWLHCMEWLHCIHGFQNIIDATIIANVEPQNPSVAINSIWKDWQLLRVLQVFMEHTVEYLPAKTILYAKRIKLYLRDDHDFMKLSAYEKLKKTIDCYAKDKSILKSSAKEKARDSCNVLFLEIVSKIIFAAASSPTMNEPPEDDLVSELIETVISTQELSPFSDKKADKTPLVRSHLLQLLLDYDMNKVKAHLQTYFTKSCDLLKGDVNFLVMCAQCFEDSYHKQASNGSFSNAIQLASDSFELAKQCIITKSPDVATLDYVESVAKFRYTLETVAWILHDYYLNPAQFEMLSKDNKHTIAKLLSSVKAFSTLDENTSKDALVVADFLAKCIVRKYGMSTLMTLSKSDTNVDFSWLIPKHLQNDPGENQKDSMVDPFVIYGKQYIDTRNSLVASQEEGTITSFKTLNLTVSDGGLILLALYGAISMYKFCNSEINEPTVSNAEGLDLLEEYIGTSIFGGDATLTEITSQLICNVQTHSNSLLAIPLMKSHCDQQLRAIVVHASVVIMSSANNTLLNPLQHFIQSSASLKDMYFPTMPHDELFENTAVSEVGKVYKCKNGHPFVVTECGKPTQLENCRVCEEPIGGLREKLTAGNIAYQGEDTTQTGHLLGPAKHLSKQATPERDLSPVACTILRLIMHATLVWGSVCVPENASVIFDVVHSTVKVEDLSQYFWQHLIRDLELLSKGIGYSTDDAALIVHLILQRMYKHNYTESNLDLLTKESRRKWEQQFYTVYIQPILDDMSSKLQDVQELITNDDMQAHNALLQTVYEKNEDDNPAATMWRYRSRITIEHLGFFIEQQKSNIECPVLKEFLKQEIKLRATQYLPDIIQLQNFFAKLYNVNVDEEQVTKLTVMDLHQESDISTLIKLVESFYNAWMLVKPYLFNYGRKKVPKEVVAEMENTPQNISLAYLIPTKTGKGLCSTALVDFLVTTHNEFIDFCHNKINTKTLKQTLPLHEVQSCYLVTNEWQFMSMVMSHCHYSFTRGEGTKVNYDLHALERHFLTQFVYGKPLFDLRTACVLHQCKYIHNSENFAAIRRNVHPQKSIPPETKRLIIEGLHDSKRLYEALETVNIILTILTNHTNPDNTSRSIGQFAKEILKCKVPAKIATCTLGNIICVWETLAVEQERRAVLANQDIFKDIGDGFKEQLDWTKEDESKFKSSLKKFHIDKLLGSLYQFIVLFIRDQTESLQSKDWPLVDTFSAFLEREEMGDPGFEAIFKSTFKAIKLSHIVDVWKMIVKSEIERNTG